MNTDDNNKTDNERSFRLTGVARLWLFLSGLWIIFTLFFYKRFLDNPEMILWFVLFPPFLLAMLIFGVHWVWKGFRKDKEK